MFRNLRVIVSLGGLLLFTGSSQGVLITDTIDLDTADISSPVQNLNGLSVKAIFTLDTNNPTQLTIELFNTSTGVPVGFGNADQLLTGISFDFGDPGYPGDPEITGGTVVIGPGGKSINFSEVITQLGPGDDVSGEWGYGNTNGSGMLANFVSANSAQTTRFPGANLDGTDNIDGPQAGIAVDPPLVSIGGVGAVADSVIITLNLNSALSDLDFLQDNGARAEFGSDAAFITPEPATISFLVLGSLAMLRWKRRK